MEKYKKTIFSIILFCIFLLSSVGSVSATCTEKNICLNSAYTDLIQFDDNTPCIACSCSFYVHDVTSGQSYSGEMSRYDDSTALFYINITDDKYELNDVLYIYYSCIVTGSNLNASTCAKINVIDCSTEASNAFFPSGTTDTSGSSTDGLLGGIIDAINNLINVNINIFPDIDLKPVSSIFTSIFGIINMFLNTFLGLFSFSLNIFIYFLTNPSDFYRDFYGYIWNFVLTFVLANALIFLFYEAFVMAYTAYKYSVYNLSFFDFIKMYIEVHVNTFELLYNNSIALFNFMLRIGNLINLTIKLFVDAILVIIDIIIPLP